MGDLLKRYEDGFRKVQPSVHFEDALKSTVSAVAGVYSERADIGLLGREIWPSEVQAFESVKVMLRPQWKLRQVPTMSLKLPMP
jgi:hypothetical protein